MSDDKERNDCDQNPALPTSYPPGMIGLVEGLKAIQRFCCHNLGKSFGEVKETVSHKLLQEGKEEMHVSKHSNRLLESEGDGQNSSAVACIRETSHDLVVPCVHSSLILNLNVALQQLR